MNEREELERQRTMTLIDNRYEVSVSVLDDGSGYTRVRFYDPVTGEKFSHWTPDPDDVEAIISAAIKSCEARTKDIS